MTTLLRPDRLWLIGGALAAAVLVVVSWLLLVTPQNNETASLQAQADEINRRATVMQSRFNQLRKENENLGEYQTKLATQRQALPTSSGMSDFLRGIQSAGERAGVSVNSVSAGTTSAITVNGAPIGVLPVSLTVVGPIANQRAFLIQLQTVQPRAVLVVGTNVASADEERSLTGTVTMTISIRIFVAQSAAAGTANQPAGSAPAGSTD
jgi:Tfp pilus assembly protein PilO